MMRFSPSVTEVARHFADYINRVAFRGERFTLMRGNKPVAELRPVPAGRRLGELPEVLASLPRLSLKDAAALAEDLDTVRRQLAEQPLRDPWAS
ncbi:MAG: type II toxin-antitoxin system Phd/YefM family antitoxin [Gemmatimonadetes bacterium]|nr:type II toxin-antitoxin system Phd/YefM family antitoxin [Gemmatimonadota bacterium]